MTIEFLPYPKTPRLRRDVVVTEKIDGTNAQIHIREFKTNGVLVSAVDEFDFAVPIGSETTLAMRVGSRNRWIKPGKHTDNYGFASWCYTNAAELIKLGVGKHFGEWWGNGIARGYGMDRKVFSLFNTARWGEHNPNTPACVSVVPVLETCRVDEINNVLEHLRITGSKASPGFMNPEGIIVYHSASKQNFKVLLEGDEIPKGGQRREHDMVPA